jgi:hemerythrin superfamily protein
VTSDAILLLKQDHKRIRQLFIDFRSAMPSVTRKRGALINKIIKALIVHAYLENEFMYRQVRKLLPDLEEDLFELYEEHHVIDVLCTELYSMHTADERFAAKATVLIEYVTNHMEKTERDLFPKVREELDRK